MSAAPALTRFPIVKFCGLRTSAEVEAAVAAGATAVGFVLTDSSRRISTGQAQRLVSAVPEAVTAIAVLDAGRLTLPVHEIAAIGAPAVQVHHPTASLVAELHAAGVQVLPAISITELHSWAGDGPILIDSPQPGSGISWDWSIFHHRAASPWILAGGLTPSSVARAVTQTRPWGVDVSSGIEVSPGAGKCPELMQRFGDEVRQIPVSTWGFSRQ